MTRLLVFADVHVGKGMDYADNRLGDYAETAKQIGTLANDGSFDAVLFAGDMFEGPHVPSSHYLLAEDFASLADEPPWVGISGNGRHDSATAQGDENAVRLLGNLNEWEDVATQPLLIPLPWHSPKLTVACLPWVSPSRFRAQMAAANVPDSMAERAMPALLASIAEALRAEARDEHPDVPCFLLAHWATTGWKLPTGLSTDQLREPLFPVEELARMDFAASFFGHVHVPGVIAPDVVSVGSPLCLDFGEEHVPHGCWIWEDGDAEFVPLDHRPFVTIDWDFRGGDWLDLAAADVEGAVVRVRYQATEEQFIDHAEMRQALYDWGAERVWQIIPEIERPARARVEGMGALHPYDAIDAWIEAQGRELPEAVRERGRDVLKEVAA